MSDTPTHPAFDQPPNTSILAWRYMDLPKLLALIVKKELYLTRLDLMPDKLEGLYPAQTSKALAQAHLASGQIDANSASNIAEGHVGFAKAVRKNLYVNCWHLDYFESEAMWRVYCGPDGGVAIVLPYEKLRASIDSGRNQAWIGVVRYLYCETELLRAPPGNMFTPALRKRKQFEYEQEARIVKLWVNFAATAPNQEPPSTAIPWNIDVIERIVVSPYTAHWYVETLRSVVGQLAPGLAAKVSQSPMALDPV